MFYSPALPPAAELALVLLAGLMLGSFASALSWRIPRGFSWTAEKKGEHARAVRSQCTHCGHNLSIPDLIPLVSWLVLRGRCRHCGAGIGVRYPLIEAGTAAACVGIYAAWGFVPPAFALMAAVPFLVALFVIDMEHMILPDQLNLLLALTGLVFLAVAPAAEPLPAVFFAHILSGLLYGGALFLTGAATSFLLRKEALGLGDVKFAVAAGLWLGTGAFPLFLILSGVLGVIWGGISRLARGQALFPFGPALIGSFYIGMLLRGQSFSLPGLFY